MSDRNYLEDSRWDWAYLVECKTCGRCGAFVGQQRLYEADDFGPAACKKCNRKDQP